MIKEFEILGEVQKIDLKIDEIKREQKQSSEKENLDFLRKKLAGARTAVDTMKEILKKEEKVLRREEGELEAISSKVEKEEKRLYDGTITDPKELRGIERETTHLKEKRDEMETQLLKKLEIIESIQEEIENLQNELKKLFEDEKESEKKYESLLIKLYNELNQIKERRHQLVEDIRLETITLYEKVRVERSGLGAVELKNGICHGCHLELPAEDIDNIINTKELRQCPYCTRIIIR